MGKSVPIGIPSRQITFVFDVLLNSQNWHTKKFGNFMENWCIPIRNNMVL